MCIRDRHQSSLYLEGTDVTLTCSANGNPPPLFSWFMNGKNLGNSPVLKIVNATLSNSGSYICQAANNAKITKIDSAVEIEGKGFVYTFSETILRYRIMYQSIIFEMKKQVLIQCNEHLYCKLGMLSGILHI